MIKMGGVICDTCRIVIAPAHSDLYHQVVKVVSGIHITKFDQDIVLCRRTKKGSVVHFCSDKCQEKLKPNERSKTSAT